MATKMIHVTLPRKSYKKGPYPIKLLEDRIRENLYDHKKGKDIFKTQKV